MILKKLPFSYYFSNLSYMEHLLRDGGDLDSMDRSLIDYNHAAKVLSASSHSVTTTGAGHAPTGHTHSASSSNVNGHGESSSPPLPPAPPTLGWFNSF